MGLKGIPTIISPELLKLLAEMGHGDTIVLADAHFPAHSIGRKHGIPVVRLDGVKEIPKLLDGVLGLIDLDSHIQFPVAVMDVTDEDKRKGLSTPLPCWIKYEKICKERMPGFNSMDLVERFEFYKRATEASVIVVTGDIAVYANVILTKGVIANLD